MNSTISSSDEYPLIHVPMREGHAIENTGQTYDLLKEFAKKETEHVLLICLDKDNKVLTIRLISIGGRGEATISIPDVIRSAVVDKAWGIVIAHNHPGGNLTPSEMDLDFVNDVMESVSGVDIHVIDIVIMSRDSYQSILNYGSKRRRAIKYKYAPMLDTIAGRISYLGRYLKEIRELVLFTAAIALVVGGKIPPEIYGFLLIGPAGIALDAIAWVVKDIIDW